MARSAGRVRVAARLEAVPGPGVALAGLVLLNLMWGGSLPATKVALESFGPFTLAAGRLVMASVLFLIALQPNALPKLPKKTDALRMAGLGVIGFAGAQALQALGTAQTSGATATVLASTGPLWIAAFAPLVLKEPLRISSVLGVMLALVGVAVVMGLGQQDVLSGAPIGALIVMLSSVAYAAYTVMGKGLAQRYSPMLFCTLSCLGGAAACIPFATWELSSQPPRTPSAEGWLLLVYLGVLVTFVGFAVWFWGLRALPAAQAGALIFLQPLSGLVLAILLLGDRPTPTFLLGCLLVLIGVYVAAGNVTTTMYWLAQARRGRMPPHRRDSG